MLEQYQTEFLTESRGARITTKSAPKKKPKAKVQKCPWAVKGQRNSAHLHIKTLDHQMVLSTGRGLDAFRGGDDDYGEVAMKLLIDHQMPPILVLNLDEGSPGYSM